MQEVCEFIKDCMGKHGDTGEPRKVKLNTGCHGDEFGNIKTDISENDRREVEKLKRFIEEDMNVAWVKYLYTMLNFIELI